MKRENSVKQIKKVKEDKNVNNKQKNRPKFMKHCGNVMKIVKN